MYLWHQDVSASASIKIVNRVNRERRGDFYFYLGTHADFAISCREMPKSLGKYKKLDVPATGSLVWRNLEKVAA